MPTAATTTQATRLARPGWQFDVVPVRRELCVRQKVASLLAALGCYVPATVSRLGPLDTIHARIGAGDDLANAQSTFLLEITEAAVIVKSATEHSLVLLDEVDRGTGTFDGLVLAGMIAARLNDRNK